MKAEFVESVGTVGLGEADWFKRTQTDAPHALGTLPTVIGDTG